MAVRFRTHDGLYANGDRCAGTIFDDEGLGYTLADVFGQDAGDHVDVAAGGPSDKDAQRPGRPRRRLGPGRDRHDQDAQRECQ